MRSQTIVINNAQTHQKDKTGKYSRNTLTGADKTYTNRMNKVHTLTVERTHLSEYFEFPFEASC